jgi:hypothetical protein
MLMSYIESVLMKEHADILGISEAERAEIDKEAEAAVDAQIKGEIEAFVHGLSS